MRSGMWTIVALLVLSSAAPCQGMATPVGPARPLGVHGLSQAMSYNPELRSLIALRGWPDWAEEVEVNSNLPLDAREVRVYYLRLDKEIAFTEAYILGKPSVGLRLDERPIPASKRDQIEQAYLAHDPARRAERAADRALAAAASAERAADSVERMADAAERFALDMERRFHRGLRK